MARPVTVDIVRFSPLRLDGNRVWKSQKNDESSAKRSFWNLANPVSPTPLQIFGWSSP
jgi:hypothetical protein